MSTFRHATAYAHTNIALIKYWGKRGARALNLPAVGSLSLTLDRFGTETSITLTEDTREVRIEDERGAPLVGGDWQRAVAFVQHVRDASGRNVGAVIRTRNDVPTAAGLASSASGFAALAVAASAVFDATDVDARVLSQRARMGSGSAARSVFGGFVRMHRGHADDGSDCYAEPLASPLDVHLVVVRCTDAKKDVPSTAGMDVSQQTSPFWRVWEDTQEADLERATRALADANLAELGEVMEHNTLKMHATTWSAQPGYWYMNPVTLAVLNAVRALKAAGTGAWFTMDAGPHVKVLCAPGDSDHIARTLGQVAGVRAVDVCQKGGAARVVSRG